RRRGGGRRARGKPPAERRTVEAREVPALVDPEDGLHDGAVHGVPVGPVRKRGREGTQTPYEPGVSEAPLLERHPPRRPALDGPRAEHEAREVHHPPVWRGVGAWGVAELA